MARRPCGDPTHEKKEDFTRPVLLSAAKKPRNNATNTMKLTTLQDLFVQELKDLYSAENQLVKALPKMAKAATHEAGAKLRQRPLHNAHSRYSRFLVDER